MLINRIKVYLFTLKLCWRSLFKLNLGDHILYQNEVWVLANGPSAPLWSVYRLSDRKRIEYLHESEFKKIRSISNWLHDIRRTWQFYSGYWHQIWFYDPSQMRSWP